MEPWGSLETQFVCRIAAQMWRVARVPGIEAELLEKMSYDMVEGEYTSLGEAFHKDIGTYDGSLGRLGHPGPQPDPPPQRVSQNPGRPPPA